MYNGGGVSFPLQLPRKTFAKLAERLKKEKIVFFLAKG
jgi:hypothetical protein